MHEDHRKRMRERYFDTGFESFADHEFLETLLYNSIPRADCNPIAHRLLEQFGSLRGVFEASVDELISVDGVGECSAMLIKSVAEGIRRFGNSMFAEKKPSLRLSDVAKYFWYRFFGLDHERLYLMLLDNRFAMIDVSIVSEGTVNSANVPTRIILERAVQKKAAGAVLAHNHPHGLSTPSDSDVEFTNRVSEMLGVVGIPLLEHLVVSDNSFSQIVRKFFRFDGLYADSADRLSLAGGSSRYIFFDVPCDVAYFRNVFSKDPSNNEVDDPDDEPPKPADKFYID